jgi:hypothetical protein
MQVFLPGKQEEVSNRRTKITKIKITDSCFISCERGEPIGARLAVPCGSRTRFLTTPQSPDAASSI